MIYFIRARHGGPIKIGCSDDPVKRLRSMQPTSPYELEIIATLDGDYLMERRLHSHLKDHIVRHEWFAPTGEVMKIAAAVKAGTFDAAILPTGGKRSWAWLRSRALEQLDELERLAA